MTERRRRNLVGVGLGACAGLVGLSVLATALVAFYVTWGLLHPARRPITRTPAAYGLPYRPIRFPSRVDHLRLVGWLIPAGSRRIVIEAHGYRENRSSDRPALPVARALHRAGIAVLMFDFRDEGRSPGKEVTVGLYEQRDLAGAVQYAQKLGYRDIGVIGYSMGAATALEVAASEPAVEATVADSPFADLYSYLQQKLSHWTNLPSWPFNAEIFFELRWFYGLNPRRVDPEKSLRHFGKRPLLLIAGTADATVPPSNSEKLYRELRGEHDKRASLWLVSGARHVGAYTRQPTEYLAKVTRFFRRYLR